MGPYEEKLASLPSVPRSHLAGDGIQPGQTPPAQEQPEQAPAATLQSADPATKFRTLDALVRSQDRMTKNDYAIDTHFRRIRQGVPFTRLDKIPNQAMWVARLPNGLNRESAAAVPNKADDLCNKVEDTLMADPAQPDPTPQVEDQTAQAAGELAAKFLKLDGSESGTNDIETYRWALNNAFTGASSYLHYRVDEDGGGYQPLQMLAHPQATDVSTPLVAMVPLQQPTIPGQPPAPPELIPERSSNPIMRYVSPQNQFVEDASQADKVWLPKLVIERMRREQVRCYPVTATVEQAAAVILIRYMSLSDAIAEWPETVGQMTGDQLLALAQWKPPQAEMIVPFAFRGTNERQSGPSLDEVGSFSPLLQRRMWSYRFYVKACTEYQSGYWLDLSGTNGGTVLDEKDMEYTVTLPTEGSVSRCLDIPVVQIRPQQDVDGGNPKGWPFISRFAGASEMEATLYGAFMDMCDNMLHPHVYIRSTASVDDDDWFDRTKPIILHPSDPEPTYEHFSTLPPILQIVQDLNEREDVMSGLTATAQGLDSSNSVSGVAKNAVVRQAQIAMSGFLQNLHAGLTRGWRIKCQLVQAVFKTPQLLDYTGTEGSEEPQWWTGENFAGVDRVGIQPGTGTMMTPESKAQYVAFLQQQRWLAPDQAADVALPGIRNDLGLPEDPYVAAIERSIDVWLQGPSPEWLQAAQQQQQVQQAYQQEVQAFQAQPAVQQHAVMAQQAQAAGLPVPPGPQPPAPPQLPALPNPFVPKPNDAEPAKATVVMKKLSRLFEDPDYAKQNPLWQQLPAAVYQRAVQALQPPPVLPHGVQIAMKGDAATVGAEEQAAAHPAQKSA